MATKSDDNVNEIKARAVSLILGPKGIEMDENGRIRFVRPEILQAIVAARPESVQPGMLEDTNTVACGANIYQCGKTS